MAYPVGISQDACAKASPAFLNGEAGEDAGFGLRFREGENGTRFVAVNDGIGDNLGIKRIRAGKNDVLAVEVDVLDVGPLDDNDGIASRRGVYSDLNGCRGQLLRPGVLVLS